MAEVLVLVDHVDGQVRKVTAELLTLARRIGTPSAVFVGSNVDAARPRLAQFGAEKVYVVDNGDLDGHPAPLAEALAAVVEQASPSAILLPSSGTNNEAAARLAVKTNSGLTTDAANVEAGDGDAPVTTQSVFAGSWTLKSQATTGLSIITVLGLQVAGIIVGAVVIEQLFSLPGIGRMLVADVGNRDLPKVQGELLVLTGFVLVVGFVVDLVHRVIDPRQREAE